MIVNGSTFRPHLGRVIRDLMLYGMVGEHKSTAIIQGKWQPPRFLLLSSGGLQRHSPVPKLNSNANVAPPSVQILVVVVIEL